MKLITKFELASYGDNELHALLRNIFNELARSEEYSAERRNALGSLDNVHAELQHRLSHPHP